MTEQKYQHEMIVTDAGFPFKLFLFEGYNGKYIRDKHWHRSIEIFAVQKGELDFIRQHALSSGGGRIRHCQQQRGACNPCGEAEPHDRAADSVKPVYSVFHRGAVHLVFTQ